MIKRTLLLALLKGLFLANVASGQLIQNQLGPPGVGEPRPVWWHKLSQGKSVVLLGKLQHEPGKEDGNIEYVVTEGGRKRIKRLSMASFSIKEALNVPAWADIDSGGVFKKGMIVSIYLPEQFNVEIQEWIGRSFKDGEEGIVFLDEVGILKPGSYYIFGLLDPTFLDKVREVIKLRERARK